MATLILLIVATGVVVLIGVIGRRGRRGNESPPTFEPPPRAANTEVDAAPDRRSVEPATAMPTASAASPVPTPTPAIPLRLQATLRPSGGPGRLQAKGMVGPARISDEDRGEFELQKSQGGAGAGPARVEDLANVVEWIEAAVDPDDVGGGVLGPVEVEPAALYRIFAWDADARYYLGEFIPPTVAPEDGLYDAGELDPISPTGIRVTLVNNFLKEPSFLLRLVRQPNEKTADLDSAMAPLIEWIAPELAGALGENVPLVIDPEKPTEFLPLFPDPAIQLKFATLAGTDGYPVDVQLERGRVKDIRIDLADVFSPESGGFLDLEGRLVNALDDSPAAGVRVERVDAPVESADLTDSDGAFHFSNLSRLDVTRFRATIETPESGRPAGPSEATFAFNPLSQNLPETATTANVEWKLPAYRWVVLDLPRARREALRNPKHPYYPIYALEMPVSDFHSITWAIAPAGQFIEEENGVAVSIDSSKERRILVSPGSMPVVQVDSLNASFFRAGEYRIKVIAGPLTAVDSEPATFGPSDTEVHTTVDLSWLEFFRPCTLVCRAKSDGSPLRYQRIQISSPYARGIPPAEFDTDGSGRVSLGPITALAFTVVCPSAGMIEGEAKRESPNATEMTVYLEPHVDIR